MVEIPADACAAVVGGLSLPLRERAADLMRKLRADAHSAYPQTEADLATLRKATRFFKTLVDGHLREE